MLIVETISCDAIKRGLAQLDRIHD